jgi:hypothetical protein
MLSISRRRLALLAATAALSSSSLALAQTPRIALGIGVRETNSTGPIGANAASPGNGGNAGTIEYVGLAGSTKSIPLDGTFTDLVFTFGSDPVSPLTGDGILTSTTGKAVLENLAIGNYQGITRPINLFIQRVEVTGLAPLTDFASVPAAFAPGVTNVLFRDPSISGTSSALITSRPTANNTIVATNPDGTTSTPPVQSTRLQFRFAYPDTTLVGRSVTSSVNTAGPVNPIIDVSNGSTVTLRVAATLGNPTYDYKGFDTGSTSTTNNWGDPANWGTSGVPNANFAAALFDEEVVLPATPVARTVVVEAPVKMQHLQFTSPNTYTINSLTAGPTGEAITLTRGANNLNPVLSVEGAPVVINAPVSYTNEGPALTGTQTAIWAPTAWVSQGTSATLAQPLSIQAVALTVGGTPTTTFEKRGPGVLTLAGGMNQDVNTVRVQSGGGTLTIANTVNRSINTVSVNGQAALRLNPDNSVSTVGTLIVSSTGNTLGAAPTNGGSVALSTLQLNSGSALKFDVAGRGAIRVNAITPIVGPPAFKLDLDNDGLIYDYSGTAPAGEAYTFIRTNVLSALGTGNWAGNGITSGLLGSGSAFGIGYAEASTLAVTSFMGQTLPDATAILFRYTYRGDSTLDGAVNFNDLLVLAQNYNNVSGTARWDQGDNTYDGNVDFSDLLGLAQNYNLTLTGSFAGDWSLAQSMVPEPTTFAALAGAGLLALRRRRR